MNRVTTASQFRQERRSYLLYFFIYCPLGVLSPLIGQYLSSIGFSGIQVGTVTSAGTAAAVLASMFWGKLYANTGAKRRQIALMFLGAASFALLTLSTTNFFLYVAIYACMYVFQGPVHGLCDSLTMDNGRNFPVVRAFGAIGFSAAIFFAGNYAETSGLQIIFYLYAAAFVIAAIIVSGEREPHHYAASGEKIRIGELFLNKKYVKLLICSFFVFGCAIGNSTYFGYLFREGGGDLGGIGLTICLMTLGEALFMLLIPAINKIIPTEKLTVVAVGLCAVRFLYYATGPSAEMLLATFLIQGMSNGIIWVEFVKYFGKIAGPRLSALAVSMFHAIGNNMSVIVCNFFGGVILDGFGAQGVYVFYGLWNAIAVVLYIIFGLHKGGEKLS